MTSRFAQIGAVVAGLAILATGGMVFPRRGLKGAVATIAIAVAIAIAAAFLLTAVRNLGT
jgi:hypothetical protein